MQPHAIPPVDLLSKYKRQTYLLAFPIGILITVLFALIVDGQRLQFTIAICMIIELALLTGLLLVKQHLLPFVELVFYFSYAAYFFIVTAVNLSQAIVDGSYTHQVLGESINSLSMWLIVFMVGSFLALPPSQMRAFFIYVLLGVMILAGQNAWMLVSRGMLDYEILFRWLSPSASLGMTGLLIQRMGVLQRKRATTDALTGLLNRHALYRVLETELERSARYGSPFSIILFDVDHFKNINDVFGHLAGDYILKEISDLVGELIRQVDHFGRWGGEEFLIVLPGTGGEQAQLLAERICQAMKDTRFAATESVSASFGVTAYCPGQNLEDMLHFADSAMYQSKQNGRGQVVVSFKS